MHTQLFPKPRVNGFLVLALFCAALVSGVPESRASSAAEKYVQRVGTSVLAAANSGSATRFRSILRRHADLRAITKFSLGRYARKLPKKERRQFQRLVENMITNAFATYSRRLRGSRVQVTGKTRRGRYGTVVSTRIVGGSGGQIKWRLVKRGGSFRVTDVNVFGVWTSLRLRSVILSKLKQERGNFATTLAALQRRN